MDRILGINFAPDKGGDGACALIADGQPVIAVAEERLTRKKYDGGFINSFLYCLEYGGSSFDSIDAFVFGSSFANDVKTSDFQAVLAEKGFHIPSAKLFRCPSHDMAHAASAFFCSPFSEALIGVADYHSGLAPSDFAGGESNSNSDSSFFIGKNNEITALKGESIPDLGSFYRYITELLGYASYQEAGKTMALAALGAGELNGLDLLGALAASNKSQWFDVLKEKVESILQRELIIGKSQNPSPEQIELAKLAQHQLEAVQADLVKEGLRKAGLNNLCLAGGLGLNCVANYHLYAQGVKNLFMQPAAGDAGLALGNAFYGYYLLRCNHKNCDYKLDNVYLGRVYGQNEINAAISRYLPYLKIIPNDGIASKVATLLQKDFIVGWFQGASEFGPRALGNRSILASPSSPSVKKRLNRIKSREFYRPYAPSVMADKVSDFFAFDGESPFMLMAIPARKEKIFLMENVVHVDGSSRIQTVTQEQNPLYCELLVKHYIDTGLPLVLNTSFNRAGEPIVETPEDAIKCFLATEMDFLALGDVLLARA